MSRVRSNMESAVHQEELTAATQKRRLDKAGEAENLGHDGEYIEPSKRQCTAYGLQSQRSQYGDFVALLVDHHCTVTGWMEPHTASSSSSEGPIDIVARDAADPSQILATGAETVLDMDFRQVDPNWDQYFDMEVGSQDHISSPDFQFTQAPVVASYEPLGLYANYDSQPASCNPMGFRQPGDSHLFADVASQENLDYMDVEVGTDSSIMDAIDTRESSASGFDQSPFAGSMAATEAATASTTPQAEEDGTGCEVEDTANNEICDTCLGMLIIDTIKLRDGFVRDLTAAGKKVLLKEYGGLIVIRDGKSNSYGGLVPQSQFKPLWKLITDKSITLSATLKSTTALEIVVYSSRRKADEIGGMLLDQDCFLQPPDSFDDSMTYFNPQCLTCGDEDESPPTWERFKTDPDTPAASLSVPEKSKVAELLDSASGPTVFRHVQVSEMLHTKLKDHQQKALAMMVEKEAGILKDAEFPSIWTEETVGVTGDLRFLNTVTGSRVYRKPKLCLGGLIADDMGLGKSLTALALIAGSVTRHSNESKPANPGTTLIVAPLSTLTGWQDQIEWHLKPGAMRFIVHHGSQRQKNADLLSSFDVVLTTYETVRAEHLKSLAGGRSAFHTISWHRIVLDEAHVIQNRSSKRFQAVHSLKAKHRWCLTGTPIQNRLQDLGSLIEFLRVDPFDSPGAFQRLFLDPISCQEGSGWERLRALIKCISLRRTKDSLENELALPPRREIICKVSLSDEERRAYNLVKRRFALAIHSGGNKMSAFQLVLRLRQICNHGLALLPVEIREWIELASRFGPQVPAPLQAETCISCGQILKDDMERDLGLESLPCAHTVCRTCLPVAKSNHQDGVGELACPVCRSKDLSKQTVGGGLPSYRPSSKIMQLLQNLNSHRHQAAVAGVPAGKSVIFSIWTGMLDLIGTALTITGVKFQRLDGTKTHEQRRDALQCFRRDENCSILLASIGSAAVGLDLTVASQVHIIEPGWNPMLERQALQRVHRLGQTQPVEQIRYVVDEEDSVERYILQRQKWKLALVDASVDGSTGMQDKLSLIEDMRVGLGIDREL